MNTTLHEATNDETNTQEWHCEHMRDGGALLYTLRQDGWRKGKPVMVNDLMVRIEPANGSQTDPAPVIEKILTALNS